jgi:hypothetical protein
MTSCIRCTSVSWDRVVRIEWKRTGSGRHNDVLANRETSATCAVDTDSKRTDGNTSANIAALTRLLPHVHKAAGGDPTQKIVSMYERNRLG